MLPLWIIDLTNNTERQRHFRSLLGKLQGVLLQEDAQAWLDDEAKHDNQQWLYTHFDNPFIETSLNDDVTMAEDIYNFQEKIVRAGQGFVKMLRKSNVDSSVTLNIVVLGDSTESLSQLTFPSIAVMIQKEKGRILPNHIHQGIAIVGAYYVPSDLNSLDVLVRQKVYLSLREIDVQHNIPSIRGYDKMFFYQDIQNRTESYFPLLSQKEQAEYLLQSMIHLYYACDKVHPLINGSSSDDCFYFALGCSSAFFDTELQDRIENASVMNHIIDVLEKEGDLEQPDEKDELIDFDRISAENIIRKFQDVDFDLSDAKMEDPNPHPIGDFLHRKLKRLYYTRYLKYYPANLRIKINDVISRESKDVLEDISATRKRYQSIYAETTLPDAIEKQLMSSDSHIGCLTRIVRNLKLFKTQIGKMRVKVKTQVEQNIWHHLFEHNVPKNLKDEFEAYHEAYSEDNDGKRNSHKCEEMKQAAMKDFVNLLQQEATFLSRLGRAFLMGTVAVFVFVPFLTMVAEDIYYFDNVKANAVYWSTLFFIIPLLIQFVCMFLYHRNKGKKERRLRAFYLHDAYARIANRIESESYGLYDYMQNLCDEYLKRCKWIEKDIRPIDLNDLYTGTDLPITMFNQPVIRGSFANNKMIDDLDNEAREIYVKRIPRRVNILDDDDCHLLIHSYKNEVMQLFGSVKVKEKNERRFDEKLGYKVFVSNAERLQEEQDFWSEERNLFKTNLKARIEKDMLPRKNPTIGEKVYAYAESLDDHNVLIPLIRAAATNGEFTSLANTEHGDVKANDHRVQSLFENEMPNNATQFQFDSHMNILNKYIFVTRWRTFDSLALNRILPSEDFDMEIRQSRVNDEDLNIFYNSPSSIILWAICQNDNSSEWLKLFDSTTFGISMEKRNVYIKRLNSKD